ncbi:hypothetical protein ACFSO7_07130 [Bacillus sp. CGMCC 1.16607]|uniref:hypothetical protein n=1 Tax=Bacillus sp. CGMCC 1.16607 TaxID=3351842 RepID=UPI00362BF4DE
MKRRFKRNNLPFLLLCFIHSTLIIYTFFRKKDRKTLFILLSSNIGLAYLFDYIILNYFHSYVYKPKLIKKRYLDNILGAILSQGIFVPFTATFITAFGFGWKVKVLLGVYFAIVERVFIRMKIFKTNWWRTIFTLILIPFSFQISDIWFKLLIKRNKVILSSSFFMIIMVSWTNLYYILFSLFRNYRFGFGFIRTWKEHFKIIPFYILALSIISSWSIKNNDGFNGKLRSLFVIKIVDIIFKKFTLFKSDFKFLFLNSGLQIGMIYLIAKLKKIVFEN